MVLGRSLLINHWEYLVPFPLQYLSPFWYQHLSFLLGNSLSLYIKSFLVFRLEQSYRCGQSKTSPWPPWLFHGQACGSKLLLRYFPKSSSMRGSFSAGWLRKFRCKLSYIILLRYNIILLILYCLDMILLRYEFGAILATLLVWK